MNCTNLIFLCCFYFFLLLAVFIMLFHEHGILVQCIEKCFPQIAFYIHIHTIIANRIYTNYSKGNKRQTQYSNFHARKEFHCKYLRALNCENLRALNCKNVCMLHDG